MFTRTVLALAIVFGTATGTFAATKKHHTRAATDALAANVKRPPSPGSKIDQRSNYPNDWSYWHRYDGDIHD